MLPEVASELREAQALGMSLFAHAQEIRNTRSSICIPISAGCARCLIF
jgi:hypothetical protein